MFPMTMAALQGLLLALCGMFTLAFAGGADYWLLMNPVFRPLSLTAGAGMLVLGLVTALGTGGRRAGIGGSLALMVMLLLAGSWRPETLLPATAGTQQPLATPGPSLTEDAPPPLGEVEYDGQTYVRLNLAELYQLATRAPQEANDGRWAMRGMVHRTPALDAAGRFILMRTTVFCCLADAVGAGVVARADPRELKEGQWLVVAGRLEPRTLSEADLRGLKTPHGVYPAVLADRELVLAHMEQIEAPGSPYIFEMRSQAPFAY